MKKILDIIENDQKSLMAQYIITKNLKHREKIAQQILALDTILYKTCDIYGKYVVNREKLHSVLCKIYTTLECLTIDKSKPTIDNINDVIQEIDLAIDILNDL